MEGNRPTTRDFRTGNPSRAPQSSATKRKPGSPREPGLPSKSRQRATLPHPPGCSTIAAEVLNFRVRNGNGCGHLAIATGKPAAGPHGSGARIDNRSCESVQTRPALEKNIGQASRPISTDRLNTLLHLHLPPINLIVSEEPSGIFRYGMSHLEVGFPLRCFQRLSDPSIATERYRWRDNSYTRGSSVPVLSY